MFSDLALNIQNYYHKNLSRDYQRIASEQDARSIATTFLRHHSSLFRRGGFLAFVLPVSHLLYGKKLNMLLLQIFFPPKSGRHTPIGAYHAITLQL